MKITADYLVELINTKIGAPIPVNVCDEPDPELVKYKAGAGVADGLLMAFSPDLEIVEVYVNYIQRLMDEFTRQGKKWTEERVEKLIRALIMHEYRHYDQFSWLKGVFGRDQAVELFRLFNTRFEYAENPIEIDAQETTEALMDKQQPKNLTTVMIKAVQDLQKRL